MADIEWLIDQIEQSPEGPDIGAFFDFDGTLIDGYSASAFFKYRLRRGEISPKEVARSIRESINIEKRGHDVDELMKVGIMAQAGRAAEEVDTWARTVFAKNLAEQIFADSYLLIEAHQRKHHSVVIASSATRPQIQATAEDLGIDDIVCTEMEVGPDGRYTGELGSAIRWGEGKADGVRDFAQEHGIDLSRSFGYSNGQEDVPFLEVVGRPCALNPDEGLRAIAKERGWPVAALVRPPSTGLLDVARSAAAVGVLSASVGTSALLALVNRDRAVGANLVASVGGDLALATAGVSLRVHGEENLWAQRPAVFLFNHQSSLDAFVIGSLLRKDFSAVAKKSLERDPVFGPVGFLTDVAYIDRSDPTKARSGLEPALEMLRKGKSIAIAPEGTRSPTPRLLPFKKGPFHLAMQAQVPVVPIVMRNCGQIMASGSYVIHPGVVDVVVLEPISSEGWTKETLNTTIAQVRQRYLDTLADWPED
jgi:putative phosphoserine phosphatase/1-acylglycerol-3-phosphate O-acyltransferase